MLHHFWWEDFTKIHTLSGRRTGSAITHNHIVHPFVARTPRQCGIPVSLEGTTPSRHNQGEIILGSLRTDIVTRGGYLFNTGGKLKGK